MPTIKKYFLQYESAVWDFVDVMVNEYGEVESIELSGHALPIQQPGIYSVYEDESQKAFWLGISSNGQVYRLDYNVQTKNLEKAQRLFSQSSKYVVIPEEIRQLPDFPASVQVSHEHERLTVEGAHYYAESQRSPSDLLTLAEVEALSIRPADVVEGTQLAGAQDDIRDKSLAYQKACEAEYTAQVREALEAIVIRYSDDYIGLKAALKVYLDEHWQTIKGHSLSYLALPDSAVTRLLVEVSLKLSRFEGNPAISYLMPDVYTQHVADEALNLDSLTLSWIFQTHVLDETGYYLLPVDLLLAHARMADEEKSYWVSPAGRLFNPYCDPQHAMDSSHAQVSWGDLEQMYRHSELTQRLRDTYNRYEAVQADAPSLLGQLNVLVPMLKRSDAHGGLGRVTDVHSAAYPAIMRFMAYYRRLHPVGLIVATSGMPLPDEIFKEDSTNLLSYVLVQSGQGSGLYCVSRYNDDGDIRTVEEACADNIILCDANTSARYALNVLVMNQFEDTAELRTKLGDTRPSVVRVPTEPPGQYHIYGRQTDGHWRFSTIQTDAAIRLPVDSVGNLIVDRVVVHPLGNVPMGIYQTINAQGAHHEQDRMLANLVRYFSESSQLCTLEQLAFIQAQTGHLDLDEFKDVPKSVRGPINDLWQFIQNPGVNLSTDSIQTCVGVIREHLEPAVRAHVDRLNRIEWSAAERQAEFQACKADVITARTELMVALEEKTYVGGRDVRPPTYAMLKALGKQLAICGPLDFKWFCHFEPESIDAFLSDEDYNPEVFPDNRSPLRYLLENYSSVEDLPRLLMEIPLSSFKPILAHFPVAMTSNELVRLINFVGDDRARALLEAVQERLPQIIQNGEQLSDVLMQLTEVQRQFVFEAIQSQMPMIVTGGSQLGAVLRAITKAERIVVLNAIQKDVPQILKDGSQLILALLPFRESQREEILECIKAYLSQILHDGIQINLVFEFLSEKQCGMVLNAIQDDLPQIIQDGLQLGVTLRNLTEAQCRVVLNAIQDDLPQILQFGSQLGDTLSCLHEMQCRVVLKAIQGDLPQIVKNGRLLSNALRPLTEELCDVVLEFVKGDLPQIIQDASQLVDAIKYLDQRQRCAVFRSVKKNLPRLREGVSNPKYQEEIEAFLKTSQYRFFSIPNSALIDPTPEPSKSKLGKGG